jgi:hypothetical protein
MLDITISTCIAYFDVLVYSLYFQVKEILEEILKGHAKKTSKVLLVVASDRKAQDISSLLKRGNCAVIDDSRSHSFTICSRCSETNNDVVTVKFSIFLCQLNLAFFASVFSVSFVIALFLTSMFLYLIFIRALYLPRVSSLAFLIAVYTD